MMAQYAGSQGVPMPKLGVGVTGLMLLAGGFSILLGFEPRIGALLLVAFLVPTAIVMHHPDAIYFNARRGVRSGL